MELRTTRFLQIAALFLSISGPASAQFTTAEQIRPILQATKANWIGVREFNGQDLLYFTHLITWRCGLEKIEYALNNTQRLVEWPFIPCDETAANPMAIPDEQTLYSSHDLGSIETITVQITYDDGEVETHQFQRNDVKIP